MYAECGWWVDACGGCASRGGEGRHRDTRNVHEESPRAIPEKRAICISCYISGPGFPQADLRAAEHPVGIL